MNNILKIKTFDFALRCLKLHDVLIKRGIQRDLARQILRSGTSIGANLKEGLFAQSKADFLTKLSIAKKEAAETEYWLELFQAHGIMSEKESESILNDCREILRLLVSTCKKIDNRK